MTTALTVVIEGEKVRSESERLDMRDVKAFPFSPESAAAPDNCLRALTVAAAP